MEKKIELLNEYLLSAQNIIERIEDDTLDISQLDIDLAKQHIRDLYDAILDLERNIKYDMEPEIAVEDDDFDVDEFVLSLDEEMADTFEEMNMGIPEGIQETSAKFEEKIPRQVSPIEDASKIDSEVEEENEVTEEEIKVDSLAPLSKSDEEFESDNKIVAEEIIPQQKEEKVEVKTEKVAEEEHKESSIAQEKKKEELKVKKKAVKAEEKPQTLFDFIEEKPSIQDKFNHLKIDDIRKAIGINEKFRFINELFKGDMNEYNDSIDKLNSFTSLAEAEKYLLTYKIRYEWDEEMDVYKEFIAIVERRYL